ncbi:MAG: hypothetical protein ACI9FJ_000322 [Alteromonadaceae bacterium]|jgi:hypothetical protein
MKKQYINSLTLLVATLGCSFTALAHHGEHDVKGSPDNKEQIKMIQCQIEMPAKVKVADKMPLTFTLTNTSGHSVKILKWNTPLEGWFNRYLSVTKDGQHINYSGAMVKRFRPSDEDYISLADGKSEQAIVDLAQGYDMSASGTYRIVYSGRLHDLQVLNGDESVAKGPTLHTLHCNELTLIVQ